jgi:15-cis-phytoene desaturase
MTSVAVLGGGVAGLTAAHELVDRGFEVTVWEKHDIFGGKARSMEVPGSGTEGRRGLPGEHGFRFFPRFYRHIPDTMRRIPFPGNRRGVLDNFVHAPEGLYAREGKPGLPTVAGFPRSPHDVAIMLRQLDSSGLGATHADWEAFGAHVWRLLTSCYERRLDEYERIVWSDFIDAAQQSPMYRSLFCGTMTKTLIAASSSGASARTVGDIVVQLLLGTIEPGPGLDRVLNGPTNDTWIDPWVSYLRGRGVTFHSAVGVSSLGVKDRQIAQVAIDTASGTEYVNADVYVLAVPVDVAATVLDDQVVGLDPTLGGVARLAQDTAWMSGIQFFLRQDVPVVKGHALYMDAPWGLTSISQQQFWKLDLGSRGDGGVHGVISVDICDWTTEGLLVKKGARQCSLEEIRQEVWHQLQCWLNVAGTDILHDDNVHSAFLDPGVITFLAGPDGVERPASSAEPMLLNEADTWHLRPNAQTGIANLFLAADYVQTYTDLATMEGASEAARRATNAILVAAHSGRDRSKIWNLHEPRVLLPWRWRDRRRFHRGQPWASVDSTIETDIAYWSRKALARLGIGRR